MPKRISFSLAYLMRRTALRSTRQESSTAEDAESAEITGRDFPCIFRDLGVPGGK
jgi:hypothetical protein